MNTLNQQMRIGIIGLGAMGKPMAERLLEAHGKLGIYGRNRSNYHALLDSGARWAETPAELAATTDAILLMVPDLPEVEALLAGPQGLLAGAEELLLMIGSTSSPTGVRELAARLERESAGRVRVIDCPVSGGEDGASAGTLSIMLGGSEPDVRLAMEILEPCGRRVHLGPLGAGQVAKACNQLIVAATILALGEASVLADRSGIDVATLFDLLGSGYAGSNLLKSRKEKISSEDYLPSGVASFMMKDLSFAKDVAGATSTDVVLLPQLFAAFDELIGNGYGDRDISVVRKYIETRGPAFSE